MNPKKQTVDQVLEQFNQTITDMNMFALAHYARLLKACSVRTPTIYREFLLP